MTSERCVAADLGLILFRRATEIGFSKLTPEELEQVACYEEAQLRALVEMPDGCDRARRAGLHLAIRDHARKTLARRRPT
jgi:hypothetical protein